MTTSIAEQFRARLSDEIEKGEYRGFPLRLRRMRAKALFEQGLMPMFFADVYRQAQGVDPADPNNTDQNRNLTPAEFDELEKFKSVLIVDCCVEPKIKLEALDAGDVLLADIPDDVREFIYLYSQRLVNFPNGKAEKEQVSAATLKPFLRDRKGPAKPAPTHPRRAKIQRTPQRAIGK